MKTVYVFSGLGADERVFHNINFGEHNVIHVKWIKANEKESIEAYALRLSKTITVKKSI